MKPIAILNVLLILIIAVYLAASLSDLVAYGLNPSEYHFGTEVAGFRYVSPAYFVGSIIATLVIGAAALAAPIFCKPEWLYSGIRLAAAAMFCVVTVFFSK
jgi:hypothetical protein